MLFNFSKNKPPEKCQVRWCRNESAPNRKICYTCKSWDYIKRNPELMVWHWIKKSAKRRGIKFDLDKLLFIEWLKRNNYVPLAGRKGNQISIDRIIPELGYTINNIQLLTKSENTKKYHNEEKHEF